MNFESLDKNGYRLLRIKDDVTQETDLSPLKSIIQSGIDSGSSNYALSFTENSTFYSKTIAILVQVLGFVKEAEGNLAIVHPNYSILEMIRVVGLGNLIETHTSEETIGL